MKPNPQKQRPAKNVSRSTSNTTSPAQTRKASTKKTTSREKIIRVPVRRSGDDAAILFFDEADALFGKRTTVGDSHDRYSARPPESKAAKRVRKPRR